MESVDESGVFSVKRDDDLVFLLLPLEELLVRTAFNKEPEVPELFGVGGDIFNALYFSCVYDSCTVSVKFQQVRQ